MIKTQKSDESDQTSQETRMPSLSWRQKLLFTLVSLALVATLLAAVGELVLRSLAPKSDDIKLAVSLPNSRREYGLCPNLQTLQKG